MRTYILLFLLGYDVETSCWHYSKSYKNVEITSATQTKQVTLQELEEYCRDFCLGDERYKAVLLDARNWYCWVFDTVDAERVRNAPEVAVATRSCLEMQYGGLHRVSY